MPELPEVETVARALREGGPTGAAPLAGRVIQSARALWPREISGLSARAFERRMPGMQVGAVGRHGKYLIVELAGGGRRAAMLIHLKMSGRLDVVPQAEARTPHARVVWMLDGGLALRFEDARKFGRVVLVDDARQVTGRLGPDALTASADVFVARLLARRGALKPILLDQAFVAGVGNIYADEALFRAGLRPTRPASGLSEEQARRLHAVVIEVLQDGIAANGASFDWVYPGGNFQDHFRVYGRTGQPCVVCGAPIRRIVVGQRSTHFCGRCQE